MYEFIKRYYRLLINKPSYWTTWFQNNALKLLQEHWGRVLLAVVTLAVILLLITWINGPVFHEQLDLTLKIIGGLFLIIGLGIATWRSATFERQIESAVKGQYSERFAKAVEQISSDQLAIRLGGLASIEALSKETEDEFIRAWTYLGEFLRYPPELAPWRNEPKAGKAKEGQLGKRPDIAAVATMLCNFDETLPWMENYPLPLKSANLQGANLKDASLVSVDLPNAYLQGASLVRANLFDANLFDANLQGASLVRANLQDANLISANLQGANLQHVYLQKRELQQLFSEDDNVLLKDAFFSLDLLKEALRIKVSMPEKMSDIYYDASDGPLPDDWPSDYKPQPITYTEWLDKRKYMC